MQMEKEKKLRLQYLYLAKYVKTKNIVTDQEEHYVMIKGAIQQEAVTLVNIMRPTQARLNI